MRGVRLTAREGELPVGVGVRESCVVAVVPLSRPIVARRHQDPIVRLEGLQHAESREHRDDRLGLGVDDAERLEHVPRLREPRVPAVEAHDLAEAHAHGSVGGVLVDREHAREPGGATNGGALVAVAVARPGLGGDAGRQRLRLQRLRAFLVEHRRLAEDRRRTVDLERLARGLDRHEGEQQRWLQGDGARGGRQRVDDVGGEGLHRGFLFFVLRGALRGSPRAMSVSAASSSRPASTSSSVPVRS